MFKKIAGTIGTRLIVAMLALLTWIFNARYLGPENVGTLGLIVFSVAIIQIMTSFMGGAGLVYYTRRAGVFRLFVPSLVWSLVISTVSAGLMWLLGNMFPIIELIPQGYFMHVLLLSLLISVTTMNLNLLLGLEKIRFFNTVGLVQAIVSFILLVISLFVLNQRDVMAYFRPLFLSYLFSTGLSLYGVWPWLKRMPLTGMKKLVVELLRFGSWVQFANIFQTLNYRLSLKFIDYFTGRAAAGILTIGLQISEGVWLVGRSVAMVQYSRLSNSTDLGYSVRLTLILVKITWMVTALAMGMLLLIPESFFILVFSAKFTGIKTLILSLSVGVVMLSMSMIFSGFFSAINKPFHNTIASAAGLLLTIGLGILLVPMFGLAGAGLAATASYTVTTIYQFVVFAKMTKIALRDFMLTRKEFTLLKSEIRQMISAGS